MAEKENFVTRQDLDTVKKVSELRGESKWVRIIGVALLVSSFTGIYQLSGLKADIAGLKVEVTALQSDVASLKEGQNALQSDVALLKEGQARITDALMQAEIIE